MVLSDSRNVLTFWDLFYKIVLLVLRGGTKNLYFLCSANGGNRPDFLDKFLKYAWPKVVRKGANVPKRLIHSKFYLIIRLKLALKMVVHRVKARSENGLVVTGRTEPHQKL